MTERWSEEYRQLVDRNLGLLGEERQERLRASKVAVFGAGGLGGTIIELLVRCGIGHLEVVDCDTFEPTNMNRQLLACRDTLGRPKVEVAQERARAINPEAVVGTCLQVTPESARDMLGGAAAGVMAIDTLRPCLVISRAARELGVPLVEGWALPYGNVRVISPATPDLEQIYGLPTRGRALESISDDELQQLGQEVLMGLGEIEGIGEFYPPEARQSIAEGRIPSFGPLVWLTAVLMALETVKVILGWGELALGPAFALYDPFRHRVPDAGRG